MTKAARKTDAPKKNEDKEPPVEESPVVPPADFDDAHEDDTNSADIVELPNLPPAKLVELTEENCKILDTKLNAKQKSELLEQLHVDDEFFKVASRRALNIEFVISQPSTTNARPFKVVAPECATLDYLKRRVLKYKLRNNDFIHLDRFCLRRPRDSEVGKPTQRLEDRRHLYNLGFFAGHSYRLDIQSVGKVNEEQKEKLIKGYSDIHMEYKDPEAKGWAAFIKGEVAGLISSQQAVGNILRAPPDAIVPTQQQSGGDDNQPQTQPQRVTSTPLGQVFTAMTPGQAFNAITPTQIGTVQPTNQSGSTKKMGRRWARDEVISLIKGVEKYETSWVCIKKYFSAKPYEEALAIQESKENVSVEDQVIDANKTTIMYKDKWRNIVKVVTEGKKTRKLALTEEERQWVLSIILHLQSQKDDVEG